MPQQQLMMLRRLHPMTLPHRTLRPRQQTLRANPPYIRRLKSGQRRLPRPVLHKPTPEKHKNGVPPCSDTPLIMTTEIPKTPHRVQGFFSKKRIFSQFTPPPHPEKF